MKWLIPKKRGQRLVGSQTKGDDSRNSMDDAAFGNFNSALLDQNVSATTSGQATLWGHLLEVGGDVPKAVLRLRNGKLFTVEVTTKIVEFVQEHELICKDIGLVGTATWRLEDWSMESFQAFSVADYRPDEISPTETFRKLREASSGRWDNIDPEQFVRDLRCDG